MRRLLSSALFLVSYTYAMAPAAAAYSSYDADECIAPVPTTYECAQQAMEAVRSHHWEDYYADNLLPFVEVADEMSGTGNHPLSACDLVDSLVVISWWETTWRARGGGGGEAGLTQVLTCESRNVECRNEFNGLGTRPERDWLRADPRNSLRWTAGYLQDRGLSYRSMRRYNGRGPRARGYSRRHFNMLDRIADWRVQPRYMPPMPRDVWSERSQHMVARADEPRGHW